MQSQALIKDKNALLGRRPLILQVPLQGNLALSLLFECFGVYAEYCTYCTLLFFFFCSSDMQYSLKVS